MTMYELIAKVFNEGGSLTVNSYEVSPCSIIVKGEVIVKRVQGRVYFRLGKGTNGIRSIINAVLDSVGVGRIYKHQGEFYWADDKISNVAWYNIL